MQSELSVGSNSMLVIAMCCLVVLADIVSQLLALRRSVPGLGPLRIFKAK
jgi:hypothetical protein